MVKTSQCDAILRHIARYGITLRPVLERLFGQVEGASVDQDLKALRDDKLIVDVPNGIEEPENSRIKYSYYFLSRKGCDLIGAPASRGRLPGIDALFRSVAILWFCCMTKIKAHRLTQEEVARLFALPYRSSDEGTVKKYVSGFHCMRKGKDFFQVHNLYVTQANVRETVTALRKRIEGAREISAVAEAIRSQEYVFTILVENPELPDKLRQEIGSQLGNEELVFNVFCAPRTWRSNGSTK